MLFFFCFFCKTGCFSEATLLCNLSLSQNTFYSYDGGGWVSPPQYFTIPVVLKLHCLLLVVSALQWQHLISCCKPPATFNFLPDRLSYCIWGLHCCMQPAVGFWMKAILLLQMNGCDVNSKDGYKPLAEWTNACRCGNKLFKHSLISDMTEELLDFFFFFFKEICIYAGNATPLIQIKLVWSKSAVIKKGCSLIDTQLFFFFFSTYWSALYGQLPNLILWFFWYLISDW